MKLDSEENFESDMLSSLSSLGWTTYPTDSESEGGTKYDQQHDRQKNTPYAKSIIIEKLQQLNDCIDSETTAKKIFKDHIRPIYIKENLFEAHKELYHHLRNGFDVEIDHRPQTVHILDTNDISNNQFEAVSQFRYNYSSIKVRPDIVLFVNGFPLVVSELKDSGQNASYKNAISDLKDYEEETPTLFYSVLMNVAATRQNFRYGPVDSEEKHYNPWKPEDITQENEYTWNESAKSLLSPERLLELFTDFVFYDEVNSSHIIPRHQQYFGTQKIVERGRKAKQHNVSGRGLIWHTQGSGKSYTMYYAARKVVNSSTQAIILVDRDSLRGSATTELRSLSPGFSDTETLFAHTKDELREGIQVGTNIIVSTIQLFSDIGTDLQTQEVYLFADEAHRFMEKDLGSDLEAALPPDENPYTHHFGFTGTPVEKSDRNTFSNYSMYGRVDESVLSEFGGDSPYLHRYSVNDGIEEDVIVPVDFVNSSDRFEWEIYGKKMDKELQQKYPEKTSAELKAAISQDITPSDVAEIPSRVEVLAEDIWEYYTTTVQHRPANKALVVSPSREAAARVGNKLQEYAEHPDEIKVIYSSNKDDSELLQEHHTTANERETIRSNFKSEENPKIIVVCDMLLTGFDAPNLGTIFLDRKLQGHQLLQAIARANRTHSNKEFGEIVDYWYSMDKISEMYQGVDDEIDQYLSQNKDAFLEKLDLRLNELAKITNFDSGTTEQDLVNAVTDKRKSQEFLERFKTAQNLRQGIQPDKRLKENDRDTKYEIFKRVKNNLQSYKEETTDNPQKPHDLKETAKETIDSNTEISRNNTERKRISIKSLPEDASSSEVRKKQKKLDAQLAAYAKQSPRYKDLSERVQEIISDWEQNVKKDKETIEEINTIIETLQELSGPTHLQKQLWVEQVIHDVVAEINEEQTDSITIEDDLATEIAQKSIEKWKSTVLVSDEFKRERKIQREIETVLIRKNRTDLLDTEFAIKATEYITNNLELFQVATNN